MISTIYPPLVEAQSASVAKATTSATSEKKVDKVDKPVVEKGSQKK